MTTDHAPDITPGYPSGGERIGPAWADLWSYLVTHPRVWHLGLTLAGDIAQRHDLAIQTGLTLLSSAAGNGLIERRYRRSGTPKRRRAEYRVP